MTYQGKVSEIIYTNEENGYSVILFDADSDVFTAVGIFPPIQEGEMLKITGEFKENKRYGEQFAVDSVEFLIPEGEMEIVKYLSSGLFKGIGEKLAKDIVKTFGEDTIEVLDKTPERLIEVSGIGRKKLMEIIVCYEETRQMKETILFLQKNDVTMNLALKIYRKYGENTIDTMKANPYVLVMDVEGVGFVTADKIAQKMGIPKNSEFRISAGLNYTLQEVAARSGHTCLPQEILLDEATKLLGVEKSLVENVYFGRMAEWKKEEADGQTLVATGVNYSTENAIAAKLVKLNLTAPKNDVNVAVELEVFERQTNILLDENQKRAIKSVFDNGVTVITGGPGTGKTTLIKGIVSILKNRGKTALLCAPTGRASKRMMEATGEEAKTIHRLLGIDSVGHSCYNDATPLKVDVLIVDEISMADIYIFNTLVKAMPLGSRLVLVGDKDQLPSVACGNILSDVISSQVINVVYLTEVYRQAAFSTIVENAHRINRGEMPLTKNTKDFFFSTKTDVRGIQNDVVSMIKTRIPSFLDVSPSDVQALAPAKRTEVGVEVLNTLLQDELNPNGMEYTYKAEGARELRFREGDRVMQTCNNYDLAWTKRNSYETSGTGVFNGDIGIVEEVHKDELTVLYDDGRRVKYDDSAISELTLAYCISVHKSQGSEFPVVVLVLGRISPMLLTRNLIYTAVTRAKKMVVIIGEESVLRYAINNNYTAKRYSLLKYLILKNKKKGDVLWGNDRF